MSGDPRDRLSPLQRRNCQDAAQAVFEVLAGEDVAKEFWQQWARKRLDISRTQWLKAAKRALDGDMRDLRLRVDLAEAPPMQIVASDSNT